MDSKFKVCRNERPYKLYALFKIIKFWNIGNICQHQFFKCSHHHSSFFSWKFVFLTHFSQKSPLQWRDRTYICFVKRFFFLRHFVLLNIWNICVSIEEKCLTHLQSISSYIKYEEGLTFYSFGLLSLYVKLLSFYPMP